MRGHIRLNSNNPSARPAASDYALHYEHRLRGDLHQRPVANIYPDVRQPGTQYSALSAGLTTTPASHPLPSLILTPEAQ